MKQVGHLDISTLGQVFTPHFIVETMLKMIKNNGRFLEPSCGDGAFYKNLPKNKIGIEIDPSVITDPNVLNIDFFSYSLDEQFDTIIGNPPYVRYQDIREATKKLLIPYSDIFDLRSNLFLFFIYKSILHLKVSGELIFITPRDFFKNTSSIKLNQFIFSQGTITDIIDLGDKKVFDVAQPNCIIWRFEKGNFKRETDSKKKFLCVNGQIFFTNNHYFVPFSNLFFVKVGAVSGADEIFTSDEFGNTDFVYSQTAKSGKTKKMIYGKYGRQCKYLLQYKELLLQRKIKKFNENNWWEWGRDYYKDDSLRIYTNTKTRNKRPFFIHQCKAYDGSVLAIFPKFKINEEQLGEICSLLNSVDWEELGFVCDGRFLFSQKSLQNCVLDERFQKFQTLAQKSIFD